MSAHPGPGTFTWLEPCFPNCIPWNTRTEGYQMLCKEQELVHSYTQNLLRKSKAEQKSLLGIFSEPLTCIRSRATSPAHLSPSPASSQPRPLDVPSPLAPVSGHIAALPSSSGGPQTHGGRGAFTAQDVPLPAELASHSLPLPGPAQGSAPGPHLGCAPRDSAGLTPPPPSRVNPAPPTQTVSYTVPVQPGPLPLHPGATRLARLCFQSP